jgi:hypothetical protein
LVLCGQAVVSGLSRLPALLRSFGIFGINAKADSDRQPPQ